MTDDSRKAFEAWAAAPPFEYRNFSRFDEGGDWPGSYINYELHGLYDAWQAGQNYARTGEAK